MRPTPRLVLALALALFASAARADNPIVRITTPVGDIDLEVCVDVSTRCLFAEPLTAANFLHYVDSDSYHDSFVHRSVPGFVIQGGSFVGDHVSFPVSQIATFGNIASEFKGFSNVRGTVAVPLAPDGPTSCDTNEDSGSSGWFINLIDNSSLDCGLFTVFAVVTDEAGLAVADTINQLFKLQLTFGTTPVTADYQCNNQGQGCTTDPVPYLVYTEFTRVPEPGAALGYGGRAGRARRANEAPCLTPDAPPTSPRCSSPSPPRSPAARSGCPSWGR